MSNFIPINRVNKFFSDDDFYLERSMGEEYLHGDLNFTLVLFSVDKKNSQTDDIYGESGKNEIRYNTPVEFKGLVQIAPPDNTSYKDNLIQRLEPGNLLISVYIHHLEELGIDIQVGDYVGYSETEKKFKYYTVVNDGRVTSDNKHTILGTRAYYRTILCTPTSPNEFNGV